MKAYALAEDQPFGYLTVRSRDTAKPTRNGAYWRCECKCGTWVSVRAFNLVKGNTVSCGCFAKEINAAPRHQRAATSYERRKKIKAPSALCLYCTKRIHRRTTTDGTLRKFCQDNCETAYWKRYHMLHKLMCDALMLKWQDENTGTRSYVRRYAFARSEQARAKQAQRRFERKRQELFGNQEAAD